MSFWFRYRDDKGTVHQVSFSPGDPIIFVGMIAVIIAMLLPLLARFREAVVASPGVTAAVILGLLMLGFALFATAKVSVIRSGRLVSFGSHAMSRPMRRLYRSGILLCIVGGLSALLYWLAALTIQQM